LGRIPHVEVDLVTKLSGEALHDSPGQPIQISVRYADSSRGSSVVFTYSLRSRSRWVSMVAGYLEVGGGGGLKVEACQGLK
jgi:hypothetical protein